MYTQTGTPYYASPEVWKDKPYTNSCDIWSLGCVIYELAALHPPFRAKSMKELSNKVIRGVYPPLPRQYSSDFARVIKKMLNVEPSRRPTASQILQIREMQVNMTETCKNLSVEQESQVANHLLGTIQIPRNLWQLDRRLPGPNYSKKPGIKRTNSEPLRLPSIDKSRDNLRSAANEVVHNKNINPIKELRWQESEDPWRPPRSRRSDRYSRNGQRYQNENSQ